MAREGDRGAGSSDVGGEGWRREKERGWKGGEAPRRWPVREIEGAAREEDEGGREGGRRREQLRWWSRVIEEGEEGECGRRGKGAK